jgi:hypothetical protein
VVRRLVGQPGRLQDGGGENSLRVSSRGERSSAVALGLALTCICAGCGPDAGELEAHRSRGLHYYSQYFEGGTPIAGPDSLIGRFVVEDGCVVLRSERFTAIPIFVPDAEVSEDRTTLTVGHTALTLDGAAVEVDGQLLSRRQAANLGYELDGPCRRHQFAFVYG